MNMSQLGEHSDSSDEDYVPHKKFEENVSEDESGDDSNDEFLNIDYNKTAVKRTKRHLKCRKKRKLHEGVSEAAKDDSHKSTNMEKTQKDEDIWADFMKDTGFQSKDEIYKRSLHHIKKQAAVSNDKKVETLKDVDKVTVTQNFQFAGEEVKVTQKVPKNEATILNQFVPENTKKTTGKIGSGVAGILGQLSKKPKISTLEKSVLDWDQFKKEENLEEELQKHNKGRNGYLEKQDFLQRADLRRFEIEKEMRTLERKKRMGNL